jgi:hypothetical protein
MNHAVNWEAISAIGQIVGADACLRKSAHARIIAASIWFPMCCHLVDCGMAIPMPSRMQSDTRSISSDHMML